MAGVVNGFQRAETISSVTRTEMSTVADSVTRLITAGIRAGLSREQACLSAMFGVLSYIRVDGLPEDAIIAEAKKAVPSTDGRT